MEECDGYAMSKIGRRDSHYADGKEPIINLVHKEDVKLNVQHASIMVNNSREVSIPQCTALVCQQCTELGM